jgi:hypothetical protein
MLHAQASLPHRTRWCRTAWVDVAGSCAPDQSARWPSSSAYAVTTLLEREESRRVPRSVPQVHFGPVDYSGVQGQPKFVEYWRWRYRDPKTGRICRTLFQLSEREAAELPDARRIEGSMLLREVDADDFPNTGPEIHCEPQENL